MAIFFSSLLPQFGDSFAALIGFGLLFCAMTLAWLSLYATVVARAGSVLQRRPIPRALDAVTGVALVALGARLSVSER
jgi:threonine/homoserine/homoserine lactone efflux protein